MGNRIVYAQDQAWILFNEENVEFIVCKKEEQDTFTLHNVENMDEFVESVGIVAGIRIGENAKKAVMKFYRDYKNETLKIEFKKRKYDFKEMLKYVQLQKEDDEDNDCESDLQLSMISLLEDILQQLEQNKKEELF